MIKYPRRYANDPSRVFKQEITPKMPQIIARHRRNQ